MTHWFVKSRSVFGKLGYFRVSVRKVRVKKAKRPTKKKQYLEYKERARALAESRLAHFNQFYNHTWNKITIRNQKTRWGSCSKNGNLNFNYKIALLPPEVADYIIVHELCHLGEFNHSANFWDLVEETIPNHIQIRKRLKKEGMAI